MIRSRNFYVLVATLNLDESPSCNLLPNNLETDLFQTVLLPRNDCDTNRVGHLILPRSDPNACPLPVNRQTSGKCETLKLTDVRVMPHLSRAMTGIACHVDRRR
ncbi:hypothetical protein CDAR_415421 [Caerostris darwini]|uniref:Uncharacterized protein n=1 Tax=Caerostris darwini TaxID=1538125 RepID=A0AAV4MLD8_9ARAC|nr:hypothetical protein CDAR_415421 [Caerostris darwini]